MFVETFAGGEHATTRLAASALRRTLARAGAGASVLDVGAGHGVLGEVARDAGAGRVVGVDRLPAPGILCVTAEAYLPAARFDVVVANLPDETLLRLAPLLVAAAGTALVVTGARLWRGRALARALASLSLEAPSALDGWCCFVGWRTTHLVKL